MQVFGRSSRGHEEALPMLPSSLGKHRVITMRINAVMALFPCKVVIPVIHLVKANSINSQVCCF